MEITCHCVDRYQERVGPRPPRFLALLPLDICRAELAEALSRPPLFVKGEKDGSELWGCLNRAGYPFTVKVSPMGTGSCATSCGPAWFWHETRHLWRQFGIKALTDKAVKARRREKEGRIHADR